MDDSKKKAGFGIAPTPSPVQAPETEKKSQKKRETAPVGPIIEPIEGELPEIEAD